jgi:hypothetical protein
MTLEKAKLWKIEIDLSFHLVLFCSSVIPLNFFKALSLFPPTEKLQIIQANPRVQ